MDESPISHSAFADTALVGGGELGAPCSSSTLSLLWGWGCFLGCLVTERWLLSEVSILLHCPIPGPLTREIRLFLVLFLPFPLAFPGFHLLQQPAKDIWGEGKHRELTMVLFPGSPDPQWVRILLSTFQSLPLFAWCIMSRFGWEE